MSFKVCKIVHPKSQGILENRDNPLWIFNSVFDGIQKLFNGLNGGVTKLAFVGSSCMYPDLDRALMEQDLGIGPVYPNNALFSYSNLLAWQLCNTISKRNNLQYFLVIPSDIFFDPKDTHFIPQIMGKMHAAKVRNERSVTLYGLGLSVRHPIFEEDFNHCLEMLMEKYEGNEPINIATPVSYAKKISSIANDIKEIIGFTGEIEWDASYSDGQKFKVLNNDKLMKTIEPKFTPWMESLEKAYERFKNEIKNDV